MDPSDSFKFLQIALEVGGVGGQVLGGGELARVDVDGDDDDVGEGFRLVNQG